MNLRQGQTWMCDEKYIRIVKIERLAVEYKIIKDLTTNQGTHHQVTKKEFCRLLKNGVVLAKDAMPRLKTEVGT
jgi:hypothetical protein